MRTLLLVGLLLAVAAPAPNPPPKVDIASPKAVVDAIPEALYPPKGESWNVAGFDRVVKWVADNLPGKTFRGSVSTEFLSKHGEGYIATREEDVTRHQISHHLWIAFEFPPSSKGNLAESGKTDVITVRGKIRTALAEDPEHPHFAITVAVEAIERIDKGKEKRD